MARCGCGGGLCNCSVVAGDNVTISGSGSAANPYVVSSEVPCETVRACLSAGDGIDFDQSTGVISADLSDQAGNNIAFGPDGGLFVPTGAATVSVGCGLTGDGSGSAPVTANTGDWPYPCSVDTLGGVVACDSNGVLRSEPRGKVSYRSFTENREYNNLTVPSAQNTRVATFTAQFTNPDTCRPALVLTERELDVSFNLPAGAAAAYDQDTDEMYYLKNTGSSSMTSVHTQTTKLLQQSASLAPGATLTVNFNVTLGRGAGGARYNRIQVAIRALMISL
ncbi:hypothetical protein [Streptomyces sp. NBC_00519]|uniref:hypothetical protein n=1 Tax=Streptomyces sp. NBC_00519 TaxID=2975764 RepID=UPI0030E5EE30